MAQEQNKKNMGKELWWIILDRILEEEDLKDIIIEKIKEVSNGCFYIKSNLRKISDLKDEATAVATKKFILLFPSKKSRNTQTQTSND